MLSPSSSPPSINDDGELGRWSDDADVRNFLKSQLTWGCQQNVPFWLQNIWENEDSCRACEKTTVHPDSIPRSPGLDRPTFFGLVVQAWQTTGRRLQNKTGSESRLRPLGVVPLPATKKDRRKRLKYTALFIYICMYTVLYYIMLYKISYIVVLYYTILYYIILYCFILYYCILYLSYYILYIVYVYLCWGCQKMGDCPPIGHQMSMTARPQLQWG